MLVTALFVIVAAFRPNLRNLAGAIGMVSLVSFCVLALPLAELNDALQRVFGINVVAIGLLGASWWMNRRHC